MGAGLIATGASVGPARVAAFAASVLFLAACGLAQAAGKDDRLEDRFPSKSKPAATTSVDIPDFRSTAPEGADQVKFELNNIRFLGATALSNDQLMDAARPFIQPQMTLDGLYRIADAVTKLYRGNGYALSFALVPAQRIVNGQADILVIEGFVADVSFESFTPAQKDFLAGSADSLRSDKPLRLSTLERFVLGLDRLPGLRARAVLKAAEGPTGGVDLTLIGDQRPVEAYANLNNRGSKAVGPVQGLVSVNVNSLLAAFDQLTVRVALASSIKELRYVGVQYSIPLGGPELRLNLGAQKSRSEPGDVIDQFDIIGDLEAFNLGIEWILTHTRRYTVILDSAFRYENTDSIALGTPIGRDKIRTFEVGGNFRFFDTVMSANNPAEWAVGVHAVVGLDVLDASERDAPDLSRADGQSEFVKLEFNARRFQPVLSDTALIVAVRGQYSDSPLLSPQQIGFGGSQIGRGYSPFEISGDHGLGGSLQLEHSLAALFGTKVLPIAYAYVDAARVETRDAAIGTTSANLSSAGLGIRVEVERWLELELEAAFPLSRDRASTGDTDPQFLFEISASY